MTSKAEAEPWQRLPSTVVPSHYDLELVPDFETFTFSGTVAVQVEIKEETSVIKLNAAELVVSKAVLTTGGEEAQAEISPIDDEVLTLTLAKPAGKGNAVLNLTFTGILNDKMRGFYRSNYINKEGKEAVMACTQFEAVDARRCLPCWDEPALKATFSVTLTAPSDLVTVSNMPAIKEEHNSNNTTRYVFDKTPPMSTYLLAFVIGEFDMIEDKTVNGVLVRCFTPAGKQEQGRFALDVAVKVLPFFTKYFEIAYPLKKLDLLAIPDFAAGAMENWGCVTYRERLLLIDPVNSSARTKQNVALTVAHEIAHQWFGNLVTMEWWTHLWLNEGFATWIEYLAVDKLFPQWKIWTQFVYSDLNRTFSLDALENSHPIEVEVKHPDEVDEIFDIISYSKGSAVIRMVVSYVGEEDFRLGMAKYLAKFQYGNALTEDLWDALSEQSGKPVRAMMEGWTLQTGFPVVTVDGYIYNNEESTLTLSLSQARFFADGLRKGDKSLWQVPVRVQISGHEVQVVSLEKECATVTLRCDAQPKWVKINAEQAGIYRVRYMPAMMERLQQAILAGDEGLTAADRLGIVNDAVALSRAGLLPTIRVLELLRAYTNETDYTVWAELSSAVSSIGSLMHHGGEDVYAKFCVFAASLFQKIFAQVGWDVKDGEDHLTALLRSRVISSLLKYRDQVALREACRRFTSHLQQQHLGDDAAGKLAPDLRGAVYASSVKHGGLLGYEAVLTLRDSSPLQEEQVRCVMALGAAKDDALVLRTLKMALTDAVRPQDAVGLIGTVGAYNTEKTWDFLRSNWDAVTKRFASSFALPRLVKIGGHFASEERAKELRDFFTAHPIKGAERTVQQTIEAIKSNHAWLSRDLAAVTQWLDAQKV